MHKNQYSNQSDQELLSHYRKDHDENWIGILLERYFHLIFGVCMKYLKNKTEAQDHTQQICMKVIGEIRRDKIKYFKAWLYQVTRNHCLMYLRKIKHQTIPLDAAAEPAGESFQSHSEFLEKEKQYDRLEGALKSLNKEQQSCIRMFYFHKKSYQEIAAEKGYSLKQVKSYIQNGRRNIKVFMEKEEGRKDHDKE